MTPQEVAMKFSSASSTCRNGKCPFSANCRGTSETCTMKEVAMTIRGLLAEIETLRAKYDVLIGIMNDVVPYIKELEGTNEKYQRTIVSFQNGYRPKPKTVRKSSRKLKRKKDLTEMDGDERYAYTEPKKPDLPVVII